MSTNNINEAERAAFEAWITSEIRKTYPHIGQESLESKLWRREDGGYRDMQTQHDWGVWQACALSSTPSNLTEGETQALLRIIAENTGKRINLSLDDLDQYLSVARAAIAADRRARQGEPDEVTGTIAELRRVAAEYSDSGFIEAPNVCIKAIRVIESFRAATKAAAPADAPMVDNVLDANAERKKYAAWQEHVDGRASTDGFEVWLAAKVDAWLDAPCRVPAEDAREQQPVAWALVSPKGGIKKLSITRDSVERRMARWLEEWPNNTPRIRPLVYGDFGAGSEKAQAGEDA